MEPPVQLGFELCQYLFYFRELSHRSNLGNLTRTEIAHNGLGVCEVVTFCVSAASFTFIPLIDKVLMKGSSEVAILQTQC